MMILRKRLDVQIAAEYYDYIKEQAERTGRTMNAVADDLLAQAIAHRRGEVIEQQSLPVIREIIQTEFRKQRAELRADRREDMALEFTNEFKAVQRASDNRLASLIVRAVRDSGIGRRLMYTMIAKTHGPDFAARAYEDAAAKAGRDLASRQESEA